MSRTSFVGLFLGSLLLGPPASSSSPDADPPLLGPIQGPEGGPDATTTAATEPQPVEAATSTQSPPQAEAPTPDRIRQAPPPPIAERPPTDRPSPAHVWVEGFWDWDPARSDFAWVAGSWRIPPTGKTWLNGSWRRDASGWYRVPGTWIDRPGARVEPTAPAPEANSTRIATDWRTQGPPADHNELAPPSPAPDTFWIPGHWAPDGDGVAWKPGFWARSQPNWEWSPARWVRRSEGWEYVEGRWDRASVANRPASATPDSRYSVARPPFDTDATTGFQPIPDADRAQADRDLASPNSAGGPTVRVVPPRTSSPYDEADPGRLGYDPRAYGDPNPYARRPGYDPIADAEAGLPPYGYGRYPYPPLRPRTYIQTPYGPPVPIYGPRDALDYARGILDQVLP